MFVEHEKREVFPNRESSHPSLDEASKLLLRAADYIEVHGHCQNGDGLDGRGRVCVIVALGTLGSFGITDEALRRLRPHVPGGWVAGWSDKSPTDQVLAKLRAVALGG